VECNPVVAAKLANEGGFIRRRLPSPVDATCIAGCDIAEWDVTNASFPVSCSDAQLRRLTADVLLVKHATASMQRIARLLSQVISLLLMASSVSAKDVDFSRDIRPILSNHCFQCHGPDDEARKADLRLDQRDAAVANHDGQMAIVPGDAAKSIVVERITSADVEARMPPTNFEKPLSQKQIDLLTKWIDSGASYTKHWSFEPIQRPSPPAVRPNDLVRNEIDNFVLATLASKNIEASPSADRYMLIRRAYLDLVGLPPSIREVDEFVADRSEDAWETLLDRVLANPHFGERWGRHWLDQARYADSHGYTNDNERSMWPYRDWVIDAFNRDLSFDQFTIEQLAGDLLENSDLSQQVATGFHRNTLINSEGGTKADQFRDEQVKDRIDTTGLVWMGLTVGCAKCHTHKFDPITQHEYYQLYAFFNSTADANSETPTLKVPTQKQSVAIADLEAKKEELKHQIANDAERAKRQQEWERGLQARVKEFSSEQVDPDTGWSVLKLSGKSLEGRAELSPLDDRSLVVSGQSGLTDEYHATALSPLTTIRSVRLQVLTHESLPRTGPGRAENGNFVLSEFWFRTGDGRELRFSVAGAEHSQPDHEVTKAIDGNGDTGWAINGAPQGSLNQDRTAWFVLPQPLEVELNHALTFKMQFKQKDYGIGRFRLSVSESEWQDNPDTATLAKLAAIPADDRSEDQNQKLEKAFLLQDAVLGPAQAALAKAAKDLDSIREAVPTTMVLQELEEPRKTHLQIRGEFLRTSDEVSAAVPTVLPDIPTGEGRKTRLDFARWLMRPDHPLTARVRVNRIWMRLFGRGLVETEDDFGTQGTLPTHPQLLDWLADQFRRNGWSTKKLLKLIMSSATYRQSSNARPQLSTIDSGNLLLARQTRIRVDAEIVRDLALSVSGRLSPVIGGEGVFPPQEEGIYAFTQRKKNWKTSTGEDRFRRGMYTWFYRSAPYPMLETFDVPKFNTTCTQRDRSNTPLQSLTVANSEAMFELAQEFAQRIQSRVESESEANTLDDDRLTFAFRLCISRNPEENELAILRRYLQQSRERFLEEDKVWTAVARLLMNLDEFITRE
jgi:hypothetical protein